MYENKRSFYKPVTEGDIVEVNVESVGTKGDGIGKIKGFVIIVPNANEGETVKVKIIRVLNKMAFAELYDGDEPAKVFEDDEEESQE
jgi:predicted RNA-binding protein with TRAM domain